ncbi:hypothetical protein [Stygiolobus caldivivus]|uniref:Uncharacterized protein n=1 Tax=Stygiolobus caldivivus TaxID=2824673 RepID=A0A8D5ZIN5_9CREN|nr:hypothetical protein [Stygiolobus caldivivus]BCU69555.1 hypothetical protein KN1_08520 [Stygiolobus caldivivus]
MVKTIDVIENLLKMGKPLTALRFLKQFIKDNSGLMRNDEECETVKRVIMSFPSLNDESWRYFVPSPPKEEIEYLIQKVKECIPLSV